MNKSVIKLYEHKRRFDYGEAAEFKNKTLKKFVKKRSHKRLRRQLKLTLVKEN